MREMFLRSSKIPECQALHIHIHATHPYGLYNTIHTIKVNIYGWLAFRIRTIFMLLMAIGFQMKALKI